MRRRARVVAAVRETVVYDDAWAKRAEEVLARAAEVNSKTRDCLMQIDLDRIITKTKNCTFVAYCTAGACQR